MIVSLSKHSFSDELCVKAAKYSDRRWSPRIDGLLSVIAVSVTIAHLFLRIFPYRNGSKYCLKIFYFRCKFPICFKTIRALVEDIIQIAEENL